MQYVVRENLNYDHWPYFPGETIDLPESIAAPLLLQGVLAIPTEGTVAVGLKTKTITRELPSQPTTVTETVVTPEAIAIPNPASKKAK